MGQRRSALLLFVGLVASAAAPAGPLTLCSVMQTPERYAGHSFTLEGYMTVGNHGVHLLEPGCGYEINLVEPDAAFPGRRAFRRLLREMRDERAMAKVRATGEFVEPPAGDPQDVESFLLRMIGPYLHLSRFEVVAFEQLSREDARRYREWLREPGERPFVPARR